MRAAVVLGIIALLGLAVFSVACQKVPVQASGTTQNNGNNVAGDSSGNALDSQFDTYSNTSDTGSAADSISDQDLIAASS